MQRTGNARVFWLTVFLVVAILCFVQIELLKTYSPMLSLPQFCSALHGMFYFCGVEVGFRFDVVHV
jgi:hypothetical protein